MGTSHVLTIYLTQTPTMESRHRVAVCVGLMAAVALVVTIVQQSESGLVHELEGEIDMGFDAYPKFAPEESFAEEATTSATESKAGWRRRRRRWNPRRRRYMGSWREKAQKLRDRAREKGEKIARAARAAAERKGKQIENAAKAAKAAAERKGKQIEKAAKAAKARAIEKAEKVKAAAERKAKKVENAAKAAKARAIEKAKQVEKAAKAAKAKAAEKARKLKAATIEKAKKAKAAAERKAKQVENAAKEKKAKAIEKAKKVAEKAKKAKAAAERKAKKVEKAAKEKKAKAIEKAEKVAEKANKVKVAAERKVKRMEKAAKEKKAKIIEKGQKDRENAKKAAEKAAKEAAEKAAEKTAKQVRAEKKGKEMDAKHTKKAKKIIEHLIDLRAYCKQAKSKAQAMLEKSVTNTALPSFIVAFGAEPPAPHKPAPVVKDGIQQLPGKWKPPPFNVVTWYAKAMGAARRKFAKSGGMDKYVLDNLDTTIVHGGRAVIHTENDQKKNPFRVQLSPGAMGVTTTPNYIKSLDVSRVPWAKIVQEDEKVAHSGDILRAARLLKFGAKNTYKSFMEEAMEHEHAKRKKYNDLEEKSALDAIKHRYETKSGSDSFKNIQMLPPAGVEGANKIPLPKYKTQKQIREEADKAAAAFVKSLAGRKSNIKTEIDVEERMAPKPKKKAAAKEAAAVKKKKGGKKKIDGKILLVPGTKIALKGGRNGHKYYCADEANRIKCNRGHLGGWEKFTVVDAGGGKVALKGGKDNKLCADETNTVRCNRRAVGGWERFTVEDAGNGLIALRGGKTGKYCADDKNGVKCNRNHLQQWEKFQVVKA